MAIGSGSTAPVGGVDTLLNQGLDYFGKDLHEDAIACWQKVLEIDPGNPTAVDYLECAGVKCADFMGVEQLIQRGIDYFSQMEFHAALASWQMALEVDPCNSRAAGYIEVLAVPGASKTPTDYQYGAKEADSGAANAQESAGADVLPGPVMFNSEAVDKPALLSLMKQKKYDEVLDMLYQARGKCPRDAGVARSIELIENNLTLKFATRIGDHSQRAQLSRPLAELTSLQIDSEQGYLLSQLEMPCPVDDLLSISGLGRYKTYKFLTDFIDRNVVLLG